MGWDGRVGGCYTVRIRLCLCLCHISRPHPACSCTKSHAGLGGIIYAVVPCVSRSDAASTTVQPACLVRRRDNTRNKTPWGIFIFVVAANLSRLLTLGCIHSLPVLCPTVCITQGLGQSRLDTLQVVPLSINRVYRWVESDPFDLIK